MPSNIYMSISKEGSIITEGAGSSESIGAFTKKNHEDEVLVLSCTHKISVPTNPQSGAIIGARQHEHLAITKFTDKTTPILQQMLTSTAKLEVSIEFWRSNEDNQGQPENFYTITLEDAKIVGIEFLSPDLTDIGVENDLPRDKISFSYTSIKWENVACSTTAQDDFNE
jgi:type VI secretion system Hcp family effector